MLVEFVQLLSGKARSVSATMSAMAPLLEDERTQPEGAQLSRMTRSGSEVRHSSQNGSYAHRAGMIFSANKRIGRMTLIRRLDNKLRREHLLR